MFRRNQNFAPITPAPTPESQKVINTLETAPDIDPRQVILVGSAALALLGVRLDPDPLNPTEQRLGDVDMSSTTAEMRRQFSSGNFSPVDNITDNKQFVIRSELTNPLPLELISRFGRSRVSDTGLYDSKFLEFWDAHSTPIEGSRFRVADINTLKKNLRAEHSDPKYRRDYTNLTNTLRNK